MRTVAGDLRGALEQIVGHPVALTCAGRTDKGVHAWGQVISCDIDVASDRLGSIASSVSQMCRPHIVVRAIEAVGGDFDARHDATGRVYRYRVSTGPVANPLDSQCWHVDAELDLDEMRRGAEPLIGMHHFGSFCKKNRTKPNATMMRDLRRIDIVEDRDEFGLRNVVFELEASAFCHQMVRSIVGLLVEIGRGRRRVADVEPILAARDRNAAPSIAPARGLTLMSVTY